MLRPNLSTHYDALKVARDAPGEVIRAAYRSLSQMHHPDRNPGDCGAAVRMAAINAAYAVLSDPLKKTAHDRWIAEEERHLTRPATAPTPARLAAVRQPRLKKTLRWRLAAALAVVVITAATLGLNLPFSSRDVWLEHAWHQSSQSAQPPQDPLMNPPRFTRSAIVPEAPYDRLRLDTSFTGGVPTVAPAARD